MAEPNANFVRQLLALEKAGVFARLHQEWFDLPGGLSEPVSRG